MSEKRDKLGEIASILGQADMLTSLGKSVAKGIRSIEVIEVRNYRWRREHVNFDSD
jgi:hypothetical protein